MERTDRLSSLFIPQARSTLYLPPNYMLLLSMTSNFTVLTSNNHQIILQNDRQMHKLLFLSEYIFFATLHNVVSSYTSTYSIFVSPPDSPHTDTSILHYIYLKWHATLVFYSTYTYNGIE